MGPLARSMLARLLAHRGDPEARDVLAGATGDPVWTADSYIAGPLAVAQVEQAWLTGTAADLPAAVWRAREWAIASRYSAIEAELCAYLRRSGPSVDAPAEPARPLGTDSCRPARRSSDGVARVGRTIRAGGRKVQADQVVVVQVAATA
jgi:hypothetical protein